jgi:preprotein translocase subunit SecD
VTSCPAAHRGLVGLLLVMIYCLLYYRGLGWCGRVAARGRRATYALVLLLSEEAGFT